MNRFLTPGFFKLLLLFSLILLAAFLLLAFAEHKGGGTSLDAGSCMCYAVV